MSAIETTCIYCASGQYSLCSRPQPTEDGYSIPCGWTVGDAPADKVKGGGLKEIDEMTDDTSAGRKRAAQLAPIMTGMRCEWAGLKFAGGGVVPILGCLSTTLADAKTQAQAQEKGADDVGHRHHGPDKAVLNNAVGANLHRICSRCHNRWHAINDPFYASTRPHVSQPFLPLSPYYAHDNDTVFTQREYEEAEAWWELEPSRRGPYPFVPSARTYAPLVDGSVDPLGSTTEDPFA